MQCSENVVNHSQVIRSSTSGTGSSACGVAPGSFGSKELHYVLRCLSPAVCRDTQTFLQVVTSVLRVNAVLPSTNRRGTTHC
jgi:hypothetical protein